MIDEPSKRKANFDAAHSVWITLADGQPWAFPKPWVAVRPVFENGKIVSSWSCFTLGREMDELLVAISQAHGTGAILAAVGLAAHMLRHQYDLSDEDLGAILVFDARQEASYAMIRQIMDVATGRSAPKASSAGAA